MNELQPLHHRLDALIAQLSPTKRKSLSQQLGRELAKSQRQRIARQQNPDGSSFTPRKTQQRNRKGSIKRQAMFAKLLTARLMKTKATANGIDIGYFGHNAQIARVHQFGLSSKVQRNATWKVKYEQRELLGLSEADIEMIEDFVIKALADE